LQVVNPLPSCCTIMRHGYIMMKCSWHSESEAQVCKKAFRLLRLPCFQCSLRRHGHWPILHLGHLIILVLSSIMVLFQFSFSFWALLVMMSVSRYLFVGLFVYGYLGSFWVFVALTPRFVPFFFPGNCIRVICNP
jgi:hypothetical protein